MFFILSKTLDVLLSPLTWGLVLSAAGVRWRRRPPRRPLRGRALAALGLATLLFFSSGYVSNALRWHLERSATSTYRSDVTYDVVVLLGGIGDERLWALTGEPAFNENVERLLTTHRLLRDGRASYAIVSGAAYDPAYAAFSEAAMLTRSLEDWGIARERLIVEDKANNTRDNAVYSAEIIRARGFRRVLVVTSAFHVPRAIECFRAVHQEADFLAVDHRAQPPVFRSSSLLPRAEFLFYSTSAIREIAGLWIYRFQGYGRR